MAPIDAIVEGFTTLLSWIGSFFTEIGKAFTSVLQWFFDVLLKPCFDFIGSLISGIIDLLENIVDFVLGFFTSLWDFFVNLFKTLFVPSDKYFETKVNDVTNTISHKVGVDVSTLESLKGVASTQTRAPIKFVIDFKIWGYSCCIDLDFIKQAQLYSQALFMGIASIFLCWYNYKNVVRLFGKNTVEGSIKE